MNAVVPNEVLGYQIKRKEFSYEIYGISKENGNGRFFHT